MLALQTVRKTCDNLIVGAGPAGLQLAQHFSNANENYVVIEAGDSAGTFFETFPRHDTLLSINKRFNYYGEAEFNLRHDWNSLLSDSEGPLFTDYSDRLFPLASELVSYLRDYSSFHKLDVMYQSRVELIEKDAKGFRVYIAAPANTHVIYRCRRVFLATGALSPAIPSNIKGIELAEGYESHSTDPTQYQNQRVAIIGQGNSAFEIANHIAGHAAIVHIFVNHKVDHAWDTHYPGDLRAVNNAILDMYQLKSLHATVGFGIKEIKQAQDEFELLLETKFEHWDPPRLDEATFRYDRVIRSTGWNYADTSLFAESTKPKTDDRGKFFELSPMWETTIPGLYCIGTTMQQRDRKAASSFIHGFRYNIRTLFHLLQESDGKGSYPGQLLPPLSSEESLDGLAKAFIDRISLTSALYQQFGVLGDVLIFNDDQLQLLHELPVDYLWNREDVRSADTVVVLTLEYGFEQYPGVPPLDFVLPPDFSVPECSAFLHPVFRRYDRGVLVEELHLNESLVLRWDLHYDTELDVNGHQNRIRNFLNRIVKVSPKDLSEDVYDSDLPPELLLQESSGQARRTSSTGIPCGYLIRTKKSSAQS